MTVMSPMRCNLVASKLGVLIHMGNTCNCQFKHLVSRIKENFSYITFQPSSSTDTILRKRKSNTNISASQILS